MRTAHIEILSAIQFKYIGKFLIVIILNIAESETFVLLNEAVLFNCLFGAF